MSVPKIKVKLRTKNGIPFAIETLSGVQFRCGICGQVFLERSELEKHLSSKDVSKLNESNFKFPEFNMNVLVKVIYTQDIKDVTNPDYPKLRKGEKFLKIKNKP